MNSMRLKQHRGLILTGLAIAALMLWFVEPAWANFAQPITDKMSEGEDQGIEIFKWVGRLALLGCLVLGLKGKIPWERALTVGCICVVIGEWGTICNFIGV